MRKLRFSVRTIVALVAWIASGGPGSELLVPAARAADVPGTTIAQLYSLPSIIGTTPQGQVWSPDGKRLAFLWNDTGQRYRDVWTYSLSARSTQRLTRHAASQPLDTEHAGVSEVVWLPGGGGRIAYVLDGRLHGVDAKGTSFELEPERTDVHDVRVSERGGVAFLSGDGLWAGVHGAAAKRLAGGDQPRVSVEKYEWAADGKQVAFVMNDSSQVRQLEIPYFSGGKTVTHRTTRAFPGDETPKRRIGVADVATGQVRWFSPADEHQPIWNYGLSADGRRLFIDTSDFMIKHRTITVYEVQSGKSAVFFDLTDPKNVQPAWAAAWAPRDAGLLILSDHEGYSHLYHVSASGAPLRRLTTGEWEIASFEVDSRNARVYFLANEAHRAQLQIYRVPFAGGKIERMSRQPGTHSAVYSAGFDVAADLFSNDTTPPDLYVQDLKGKAGEARVTTSPRPEFARIELANVSYVEFKSHVDGAPLLGRLSLPKNFDPNKKYPLLMGSIYPNSVRNRWGAGNAIPTWGLDQNLVERGYILMKVDTAGSLGHGRLARQRQFRDYGGRDTDDVESGVRYVVQLGYADPARVGIWGWSYGGLMTLMSLYKKPDLYAAGIADAPASNVAHAFPEQMWVMGPPEGDDFPARYERMSALYHTAGLTKPLMITHASKDDVVLYSDTIALTERMIANGKQFELVTLPGSSHVWARDSVAQQKFGYQKMVDFFDRYLRP